MSDMQLSERHAAWLEDVRKIPAEIAAQEGVVTTPKGTLAFEYRRNGVLQYRKGIVWEADGSKRCMRDRKGATTCLWGIDTLRDGQEAVITEGEIDRLSVLTAGCGPAVSVPDGAQLAKPGEEDVNPLDDTTFAWLWDGAELIPELRHQTRIVLAVDDDPKGRVLREELAVRLGRDRCWWVRFPEGCKDANEVLVEHGADALRRCIEAAEPMVPDRLVALEAFDHVPDPEVFRLGIDVLGDKLILTAPELMVISGPPNHGKSQVALWIAAQFAMMHRLRVAYLQFEDSPARNITDLQRFAVHHVPRCADAFAARKWVSDHFRFVAPSERDGEHDLDLAWLEKTIEMAATRESCRMVIIDPWNEVEHAWSRQESQAQYLNRAIRHLKRLARRFRIILVIVAHPDKASGLNLKNVDDWNLYALDGGAAWNNKADHGVIVFREPDNKTWINVTKSKDWSRMGRPGKAALRFDSGRGAYREEINADAD